MINFLNLYHFNVNIILLPLLHIMSRNEEAGEEGLLTDDLLYQKVVVQLVGESPIRVNARELGSYSRMFLGNRRCLQRC